MLRQIIFLCCKSNRPPRLPKLNPGPIALPYITSTDGIARADQTRLVHDRDRQITLRRVEEAAKVKERLKKVGILACLLFFRL